MQLVPGWFTILRQAGSTCGFTFSLAEPNTCGSGKAVNYTLSVIQRLHCKEVTLYDARKWTVVEIF